MAQAETGSTDDIREIRLFENPDGQWTARDCQVEVTAQGQTRAESLANLDAVVDAVTGEGGHEPTDAEIRALGVDPTTARARSDTLPDALE